MTFKLQLLFKWLSVLQQILLLGNKKYPGELKILVNTDRTKVHVLVHYSAFIYPLIFIHLARVSFQTLYSTSSIHFKWKPGSGC